MSDLSFERKAYVVVTDYMQTDGVSDVSDAIQKIIDDNPNRTIYFPDGVYVLKKPICTPADPVKSVSLELANYAVIKAAEDWDHDEALVRLGGKDPFNTIYVNGSNYNLSGGIIDGSGKANGISIDSGRETRVHEVSIKHTKIGLHIKRGANSGSSDADIINVHIVGNGAPDSIGVLVEGLDNSFTNMRIARVFTGFHLKTAGNFLRHIHPLYTCDYTNYAESCAFLDEGGNNWYNNCYNDQFAIGFRAVHSKGGFLDGCFCYWYSSREGKHVAFKADKKFESIVTNFTIGFRDLKTENIVLEVGEDGGRGVLNRVLSHPDLFTDDTYKQYLQGGVWEWNI